jgi:hypothetical protein
MRIRCYAGAGPRFWGCVMTDWKPGNEPQLGLFRHGGPYPCPCQQASRESLELRANGRALPCWQLTVAGLACNVSFCFVFLRERFNHVDGRSRPPNFNEGEHSHSQKRKPELLIGSASQTTKAYKAKDLELHGIHADPII